METPTYIVLAIVLVLLFVGLSGANGINYTKACNEQFTQAQLINLMQNNRDSGIPPDTAFAAQALVNNGTPESKNIIIYNSRPDPRSEGFVRDIVPFTGQQRIPFYQPNVISIDERCNDIGY